MQTPPQDSELDITLLESTKGHCLQLQVKFGKATLFLIQEGNYHEISSWPDLAKCISRTKEFVEDPAQPAPPISIYHTERISLKAGDCVIIPPGMIFFFRKRASCSIISGCKFFCKETLHLTYPWMRLGDYLNADETLGKYWAEMKRIIMGESMVIVSWVLFDD